MRVALLTEGGYPFAADAAGHRPDAAGPATGSTAPAGRTGPWCDRLVRGLEPYAFDVYALSSSAAQERAGWLPLPRTVRRVHTAPLWTPPGELSGPRHGRRARRRFLACYEEFAASVCSTDPQEADRFAAALYALAAFARAEGPVAALLRSEEALRVLECACRAPGALRPARTARPADLLTAAAAIERTLRPLSLGWYGARALGSADLCHAASGGAAAVPALLARHFWGVPLLVTEDEMVLRTQYLAHARAGAPVRALLAALHTRLAAETYRQAVRVTAGSARVRRWQEHCGAPRARLRTVHPGMAAVRPFTETGAHGTQGEPGTLVWAGHLTPGKDLVCLLHAFAEVRRALPRARLRIVGTAGGPGSTAYAAHCRALAAHLFPDEAADLHSVGENPVSFEVAEAGAGAAPGAGADPAAWAARRAAAYAAGSAVVLSSAVSDTDGIPESLVEAMFCGRATVATDVGAVVEAVGITGLVVPPRNPKALAEACVTLLRDPDRRALLGAAARARALELFTVEQNLRAFDRTYRDIADSVGLAAPVGAPGTPGVPDRTPGASEDGPEVPEDGPGVPEDGPGVLVGADGGASGSACGGGTREGRSGDVRAGLRAHFPEGAGAGGREGSPSRGVPEGASPGGTPGACRSGPEAASARGRSRVPGSAAVTVSAIGADAGGNAGAAAVQGGTR